MNALRTVDALRPVRAVRAMDVLRAVDALRAVDVLRPMDGLRSMDALSTLDAPTAVGALRAVDALKVVHYSIYTPCPLVITVRPAPRPHGDQQHSGCHYILDGRRRTAASTPSEAYSVSRGGGAFSRRGAARNLAWTHHTHTHHPTTYSNLALPREHPPLPPETPFFTTISSPSPTSSTTRPPSTPIPYAAPAVQRPRGELQVYTFPICLGWGVPIRPVCSHEVSISSGVGGSVVALCDDSKVSAGGHFL